MLLLAIQHVLAVVPTRSLIAHPQHPAVSPPLDTLMLFGFLAALPTIFWKLYSPRTAVHHVLSALCFGGIAAYAFLEGAWPVGLVELVSSAIALRPLWAKSSSRVTADRQDRISRLFGRREAPTARPVPPPYFNGGDALAASKN